MWKWKFGSFRDNRKFEKYICRGKSEYINSATPSALEKLADFLWSISELDHSTSKTPMLTSLSYFWGSALHNLVIARLTSRSYARFHHLIFLGSSKFRWISCRETDRRVLGSGDSSSVYPLSVLVHWLPSLSGSCFSTFHFNASFVFWFITAIIRYAY